MAIEGDYRARRSRLQAELKKTPQTTRPLIEESVRLTDMSMDAFRGFQSVAQAVLDALERRAAADEASLGELGASLGELGAVQQLQGDRSNAALRQVKGAVEALPATLARMRASVDDLRRIRRRLVTEVVTFAEKALYAAFTGDIAERDRAALARFGKLVLSVLKKWPLPGSPGDAAEGLEAIHDITFGPEQKRQVGREYVSDFEQYNRYLSDWLVLSLVALAGVLAAAPWSQGPSP
jgi:hypothetical protein